MKEAAFLSKAENEGGGAFLSMTERKKRVLPPLILANFIFLGAGKIVKGK
jgi:hypothetical protein